MNYKMQQLMKVMLARYPDVMFYYVLPKVLPESGDTEWQIDYDWLLQHPDRIKYVHVEQNKDRMREYMRIPPELVEMIKHNGTHWDFDMMISGRSSQIGGMRVYSHIFGSALKNLKRFIVVDDMPILSYKQFVSQVIPEYQDLETLSAYMASHGVYFVNFWEKDWTVKLAREYFTPTMARELRDKLHYSSPVLVEGKDIRPKSKEFVQAMHERTKPFTVGYTQRWERAHRRSEDIVQMMEKQWVYRGGKFPMRFMITSNSVVGSCKKREFLEIHRLAREEFWRVVKEEMSVIIVLAPEDGYSLSVLEPICMGVPVVLQRAAWSEAMFGKDYPFFCGGERGAYALTKVLFDDYANQYEKFVRWQQGPFKDLMAERNKIYLPEQFMQEIDKWHSEFEVFKGKYKPNTITEELLAMGTDEIVIDRDLALLEDQGKIRRGLITGKKRLGYQHVERFRCKIDLMASGWEEASLETGHLRRKT